jgi:hypothetical protein
MSSNPSSQPAPESDAERPLPNRREILAAAAALLATAAGSPAQAAGGAEGYFLAFDDVDRMFFIPSAWLELFEVTDVYKANFPAASWDMALLRLRTTNHQKKKRFSALYADSADPGMQLPFPNSSIIPPVPPGSNQTYLAAMMAPASFPT